VIIMHRLLTADTRASLLAELRQAKVAEEAAYREFRRIGTYASERAWDRALEREDRAFTAAAERGAL
jgi:hypothetical protein